MRFLFFLLFVTKAVLCIAQTGSELNEQSKKLLVKEDYKNAVPLIKKAADMGNPEAQYNLGICYEEGIEVSKSEVIANEWLLKSAKQGWKDAQFKIAYSYAVGRGIEKNDKEAFYWALQCAKQDDPECLWNVLNCYLEGRGVTRNIDSMLYWAIYLGSMKNPEDLKMSGEITNARLNLAKMYSSGNMVKMDKAKSYVWYLLYNESKRDNSILVQQDAIKSVKDLEKELNEEQKLAAKKQAEAYLKMPLQNLANLYKEDI